MAKRASYLRLTAKHRSELAAAEVSLKVSRV
jgi:hypothetical protein